MRPEITLLLHGPYGGNSYKEIFAGLFKLKSDICENIQILLVHYSQDFAKTKKTIDDVNTAKLPVQYVGVKDLFNPGFYNINRQIATVSEGLKEISSERFVIKLRNDQWVDFKKLFRYLDHLGWLGEKSGPGLITTNCYTRIDRLYHPSDMFICGRAEELKLYYGCPLRTETHMDYQLSVVEEVKYRTEEFGSYFLAPENMLFRHYLQVKNWDIKNTQEDSFAAIKYYFYIVNTWNIGLRWIKDRNPYLGSGSIILPCTYNLSPFSGAPIEKARCYSASDFGEKKTLKDVYYLYLAQFLFYMKYTSQKKLRRKISSTVVRIGRSAHMPENVKRFIKKTFIGRAYYKCKNFY